MTDPSHPLPSPAGPGGGSRTALWVAMAYGAVYEVARRVAPEEHRTAVTNAGLLVLSALLTLSAVRIAVRWRGRKAARAWWLLAAAFGLDGLGDAAWFVMEDLWGQDPAGSVVANLPYFANYLFVVVGLASFPDVLRSRTDRTRLLLDVGVVFVAGVTATWRFVLQPRLAAVAGSAEPDLLPLLHPVGDLLLFLGIVLVVLRRPPSLPPRSVALLGVGFFLSFAADVLWSALELRGIYETGGIADTLWLVATLARLAACEEARLAPPRDDAARAADLQPPTGLSAIPYVAAASAYLILLAEAWRLDGRTGVDLVTGVVGLTSLVVARQLLAVRENARLWSERAQLLGDARLSALARNAADAVFVVEPEGTVRWASPATRRVLGLDAGTLVGRPFGEIVAAHDRDAMAALLMLVADRPDTPVRGEWEGAATAEGRTRRIEATVSNLRGDPAVGGLVVNLRDVTDRANLERQLTHQAFHDPLTGLSNRSLFGDRVEQALARAARSGHVLAVYFVDLDDFKLVNDGLGHPAGDALLVQVARRLRTALRQSDSAARLGGDEFSVLAEDLTHEAAALDVGDRLRATFDAPFALEGRDVHVSASIGIAIAGPGDTRETLLRNADTAMYAAKARKRGATQLFEPAMHAAAVESIELQTALRTAVERDELRVVYQPIVDVATGHVVAYEALVRWTHPTYGHVAPSRFIPLAEASGSIVSLGRWILERAVAEIAKFRGDVGAPAPWLSVNVSGRQLEDPGFLALVREAVDRVGLAPERLCLEFTEGVLLRDSATLRSTLVGLRDLGIRLGIDDFGTGYSSLGYLQSFPLDVLKIPREFVERIVDDHGTSALAHSIVALAAALGLLVVAEGVETTEQAAALRRMGCAMAQGWLYGRPGPLPSTPRAATHAPA